MATSRKARRTRKTSRTTKIGAAGLHPVFGPVTDPGPDGLGGGWGGLGGGWGGAWHFGPVADPGPGFGGWRGSVFGPIDPGALDASTVKQLAALRVRRLNAAARSLEEQAAIADEEFKLLSRAPDKLRIDRARLPPHIDFGDPVPDLRPIDILRYVYELRGAAVQRTVAYLKEAAKAVEAAS